MEIARSAVVRWGLAVLYLLLVMALIFLFPSAARPFLLLLYVLYAAWNYWSQEAVASREWDLRPLTAGDVPDWPHLRERLVAACAEAGLRRAPWFAVMRSRQLNAMAVGGHRGLVVFTTALLKELSEAEILAIAGHELQHLAGRDSLPAVLGCAWLRIMGGTLAVLDGLSETTAPVLNTAAALGVIVLGASLKAVAWVGDVVLAHRSRQQEHLADLAGARLTSAAVMQSALRHLAAQESDGGAAKLAPWSPAWIARRLNASHPPTDVRISCLEAAAERGEIGA